MTREPIEVVIPVSSVKETVRAILEVALGHGTQAEAIRRLLERKPLPGDET